MDYKSEFSVVSGHKIIGSLFVGNGYFSFVYNIGSILEKRVCVELGLKSFGTTICL